MHVVVFGAGGIGGYLIGKLGPLLSKAGTGLDTLSVIARGEHLQAIQSQGLLYRDPEGNEYRTYPSIATDSPDQLPWADLIFLCVKGYDLDEAVQSIERFVHSSTIVLPLLNGGDIYERVGDKLGKGRVLPGAIYISSSITAPGCVTHTGGKGHIVTGAEPGGSVEQPSELANLLVRGSIPFTWFPDPLPAIWTKYVFIAPFCLVTAVADKTIGEVCADPQLNGDVRALIGEVAAVAGALGVRLPDDIVEQTMEKAASFPGDTKTSFQRDVEQGRVKDERDLFGGTVLRLGKQTGTATPETEKYHNRLP